MAGETKPTSGYREEDPFDLWLQRRLHEAFDAAAREPIPKDLLRLASDSPAEWERYRTTWLEQPQKP